MIDYDRFASQIARWEEAAGGWAFGNLPEDQRAVWGALWAEDEANAARYDPVEHAKRLAEVDRVLAALGAGAEPR